MMDLILSVARSDDRVRAVILNGSRANPNAKKDPFQDYDIVYLVTDIRSFKQDPDWIDVFGERMILQLPDDMGSPPPEPHAGYAYLMQFMDGNRIDLTLYPKGKVNDIIQDSLSVLLLNKDGDLPPLEMASEKSYLPKPPTRKEFDDCCNEFWWICPYAAKGLRRGEILYAKYMVDQVLREQLMKMLTWYIGLQTGYTINPGKFGKHFEKFLPDDLWALLLKTHTDADYERNWKVLEVMGQLFHRVAVMVAEKYGFSYPELEDERVCKFIKDIEDFDDSGEN
jgi:aminoglycoside 6-adenylyltransferase